MFTIKEILDCTGGRLINPSRKNSRIVGVSTDSREINQNELFVAIKGNRFDGHQFIDQACYRGAGAILLARSSAPATSARRNLNATPTIEVKDTISALGALAFRHRMKFEIPVVAVTGSNGKTTTKEMLSSLLGTRFKVLRNPGTENNHIGVPLTMLKLTKRHHCAVLEIGANHPGEIDRLSWMIQPTVGIITNIEPSHLEFFKDLQGVRRAKLELTRNLAKGSSLIINKDDRLLARLHEGSFKIVSFGFKPIADFSGQIIRQTNTQTYFWLNERHRLLLNIPGRHNVYNALASIACARGLGITFREIEQALAVFQAPPMRMQMLTLDDISIINDCYNSNPSSLDWALRFLREYSCVGKRIVVCGDMLELGKRAQALHAEAGKRIARDKIDFLITVGALSRNIAFAASLAGMSQSLIRTYKNSSAASKFLRRTVGAGDTILIKGSRAMQMENIIKCFTKFYTR